MFVEVHRRNPSRLWAETRWSNGPNVEMVSMAVGGEQKESNGILAASADVRLVDV